MKKIVVLMMVLSLGLVSGCGASSATEVSSVVSEQTKADTAVNDGDEKTTEDNSSKETADETATEQDKDDIEVDESEVNESSEAGDSADNSGDIDQTLIRDAFKAAMDEYEEFYDEYCEFMKKYAKASSEDAIAMMSDYSNMLLQLSEMDEKFKAWDSSDLTTAEMAYYIDVTARIEKKLLEVASY